MAEDEGAVLSWIEVPSRFGRFAVEGDEWGLTRLVLPGGPAGAGSSGAGPSHVPSCLDAAADQLTDYLNRRRSEFELPRHLTGTPFQLEVWDALATVGYGSTVTYADVAAMIGRPTAFRAVGGALGANPLPIVVPCHRVVATGGGLGGYAGGTELKAALVDLESAGVVGDRRNAAVG
jgi:methylated-DNA-[protein]-cysteine S-methyltransferase